MSVRLPGKFKCAAIVALTVSALASSGSALAEVDWVSVTTDNDAFVGNDNGYTNGIFVSWIDTPEGKKAEPGFLAHAMPFMHFRGGPDQGFARPDEISK